MTGPEPTICNLALAEIEDCDFWTADQRLCNALAKKAPRLKYVGELNTSTA